MAIDTDNKKLAVMEMDCIFEPAIPLLPGTFGQDDKQQLLWGYPGILWAALVQTFNWVIQAPTIADGILLTIGIIADDSASLLDSGSATSSGGVFEFQANVSVVNGDRHIAFLHDWAGDTLDQEINGGVAIAEAVLQ
jgi:hypothetical protein